MDMNEIKISAKKAIENSGFSQDQVARHLNYSPTSVSKWLSPDNEFPLERVKDLCQFLNDDFFNIKVFEYITGFRILPENAEQIILQMSWFASEKEESERKNLEKNPEFNELMSSNNWADHIEFAEQYYKEFDEEVSAELYHVITLKTAIRKSSSSLKISW